MKTAELTGADLDYWVARGLGAKAKMSEKNERGLCLVLEIDEEHGDGAGWFPFSPSTAWEHGGPLIERERISTIALVTSPGTWLGQRDYGDNRIYAGYGPTPLIAAMRCYVSSVFGPDVDAKA